MAKHKQRTLPKITLLHNIVVPYRTPLFEEIAKRCDLTVFFYSQGATGRRWDTDQGDTAFRYIYLRRFAFDPVIINPLLLWTLLRQKTDVYIVVDNEENMFSNLLVAAYGRLRKKPYVLWSGHIPIEQGTIHPMTFHKTLMHKWPIKNIYTSVTDRINQYLYDHAASFVAYSEMSKRYLIQHGAKDSKILVGTQAMAREQMPVPTKHLPLNHKKLQLLYLGYFRPEKGIDILIRATLKLPEAAVDLHILGDGPEGAALKELARSAKNIHFHDYANAQERANWYSSVDMFVLPTYFDPWAHVITESLYYGTPAILTSSAGASSIITDSKNGFVVPAGNVDALFAVLQKLLDNPGVVKKMRQYIANEIKDARYYDVSADADNFAKAIGMARGA